MLISKPSYLKESTAFKATPNRQAGASSASSACAANMTCAFGRLTIRPTAWVCSLTFYRYFDYVNMDTHLEPSSLALRININRKCVSKQTNLDVLKF